LCAPADSAVGRAELNRRLAAELCSGGDGTSTRALAQYAHLTLAAVFDRICNSPGGHFTEDEGRRAARTLCEALAEVHGNGTIVRHCLEVLEDEI
jgi:hypothetical protein